MSRRHRGLSALLVTVLTVGGIVLLPAAPAVAATTVSDWASLRAAVNDATDDITVELGADINNPNRQNLSVPIGVTVTLMLGAHNLTVDNPGAGAPGIRVQSGAGLVIDGTTGILVAKGGAGAAGIGGGSGTDQHGESAGAITIHGGEVRATAGEAVPSRGAAGAGIGGGGGGNTTSGTAGRDGGDGGVVTITGGTVIARGVTTNTVRDGAGIGGGGASLANGAGRDGVGGDGAQVTITGGTTSAYGGRNASGIGAGGSYRSGAAGTLSVQGVAAPGSVTTGGRRSGAETFTKAASIQATGTPADQVFRAQRAGDDFTVRIDYPDAVTFDTHGGTPSYAPIVLAGGSLVPTPSEPTRVGHTFTGWFADAAATTPWDFATHTTSPGVTTLHAGWDVNSYSVSFVANGGSAVASQDVDYGTLVTDPTVTREGYSLVGWFTDAELSVPWDIATDTMPANAITLYAAWSINSYSVTFVANGGSAVPARSVVFDTVVTEPTAPTREGHTFVGWFADAALTDAWDFAADAMPASDITLYAAWEVNSYSVSFDANGGSAVASQGVDYGTFVTEPAAPTRVGHTFVGWFADAALSDAWEFAADTVPAHAITLYAGWSVNSYSVSFVANGGSAVAAQDADYDTLVTEPVAPTREGHTFRGWFADAALTDSWDFAADTVPAHAITLYADWSINSYSVTFVANGGSAVPGQSVVFGSLVTEPTAPTREGHTFVGWFADAALTDAWDFAADPVPASDITLSAAWDVNSYSVSFDANGGSAVASQGADYGTLVTEPPAPIREGHSFLGWFADAALTDAWDFAADTVPAHAITLYAAWDVNSYTVSFDENGGSFVSGQDVDFGTLVTEPTAPTREGHTFVGWFADASLATAWDFDSDTMPASAITLYAAWDVNSYTVSFAVNGGSAVPPQSEVFDTLVTEPTAPTRDGHTFAGWFADAALATVWDFAVDRVPASPVTLYAKWSINSYTVSFDPAGGTAVPDQTITYGSPIAPMTPPTRTGYVFAGWYSGVIEWAPERPVLGDVALAARWTPIEVEVVPGPHQALISWGTVALPSGAATGYTATVEPGGLSCTTATTVCAVTGLTPGSYSVVVTAHWAGSSAVSDAVAFDIVELAMPADAPTESTPAIEIALRSGGSPITSAIPDARITVVGSGFVPGSSVELFVYSDPEPLGTTTAGSDGTISVGVVVPAGLDLGAHTIVARGFSADARDVGYGVASLAVIAPALSSTGVEGDLWVPLLAIVVLLVLGALGTLYGRRRGTTAGEARTTEIGG